MEKARHVLLAGAGAERFARRQGLAMVEPDYFSTPQRIAALERAKRPVKARLSEADRHGTVGAVALDRFGNLAAATSTGGMTNKMVGRIGDTPLIGAGTYADNEACAVSATGEGELFIRAAVAHEVSARMRHAGESLASAAEAALARVTALGGTGGLVAIDRRGRIAMPFTSAGMYRGSVTAAGDFTTAIFKK
jgi:isoaspartyl peptidase/L-asparaginase-like protein (Ntn-hydrolase superfamily)